MKSIKLFRFLQKTGPFMLCLIAFGCSSEKKSDAYGQFEATETTISSEVGGKVLIFSVEEGDVLEKEQQVGLVDTTKLSLQVRELRAKLKAVQSQIENVNANVEVRKQELELARTNSNRVQAMHEDSAAPDQKPEDTRARGETLKKKINALQTNKQSRRAEVNAIQARIDQVLNQLKDARIVNPVDGTVLNSFVEPFEVVRQGQPLYQIANLDTL